MRLSGALVPKQEPPSFLAPRIGLRTVSARGLVVFLLVSLSGLADYLHLIHATHQVAYRFDFRTFLFKRHNKFDKIEGIDAE
jgi:hypothetical protein